MIALAIFMFGIYVGVVYATPSFKQVGESCMTNDECVSRLCLSTDTGNVCSIPPTFKIDNVLTISLIAMVAGITIYLMVK